MKPQILSAAIRFHRQPFLKPLQLSTGLITEITEARASVTVRVDGREATGYGSIYLSDLWAWPDLALSHVTRDRVLRALCERIAADLPGLCGGEPAHPLELGLRLHHSIAESGEFSQEYFVDGAGFNVPVLARAMCASPFDAAIHDATGQALSVSAFDFYGEPWPVPSADKYFPDSGACRAIGGLLQPPRRELNAWLIVGASDDLEKQVAPWVQKRGYHCFKLKIGGKDNASDVARTIEVYHAACRFGSKQPRLSIDSNEANSDAASVLEYLQRLREQDAAAFAALEYLEQPTGRDITQHRFDWREVTQIKPVFLDEGLTSLDLLEEAQAQGWSGLALKTCKGHSFALVAAAWAQQRGMLLTMQDLTNPGLAVIHSMLFAARIPAINGIELNSPQYTPAANAPWLPRLNTLLEPRNGCHRLEAPALTGLGSNL